MNVPCRCRKCETRRTLPKHPADYVRPPKCKCCGAVLTYVCLDRMPRKWGRKKKCHCTGYMFPHRRGSKWCLHNKNYPMEARVA